MHSSLVPTPAMPPTNYDELKQAITARYPAMSKQLQGIARFALERPNELALGTVAAIAERRRRAAVGDGPFRQRARLRRLLGDAADLPRAPGRAVGQLPRAHRAAAPEQAQWRSGAAPAGVLHQSVSDAIAELGHLEESVTRRAVQRRDPSASPARRGFTCWRSGARFRWPAIWPTRWASSNCARTCSTASAACSSEVVRGIAPREVLIAVSFRNYSPGVIEAAADCHRRGVPVIAITDSPLSPLKANAADVASSWATIRAGRSARWWRRCASRRRWWSAPGTSWPGAAEQRRGQRSRAHGAAA